MVYKHPDSLFVLVVDGLQYVADNSDQALDWLLAYRATGELPRNADILIEDPPCYLRSNLK
jgi:hypothetical protein